MNVITVTPGMSSLLLGKQGENKSTKFLFDVSGWLEKYPGCTITLVNRRPYESVSYPCVLTTEDDGKRGWVINSADLAKDGDGEAELKCTLGDMIEKERKTWNTKIMKSLSGEGDAPEPWESMMDDIEALVGDAQDAAAAAEDAVEHYPKIEDGYWYVWDATNNEWVNTGIPAQGPQGETGATGAQGPAGPSGPSGPAGQDGRDGNDGQDGQDGYTPERGTDYWTAEDKAEIVEDVVTEMIDDEAGEGDTDKVWSADKSHELSTEINSRPEVKESTETGIDLDVSDEDGNVILRFENGHIKTKNFDSENANGVKDSTATGIDLDIADDDGYVVARFKDGHIQTKNFDSSKVGDLANLNTTEKSTIVGAVNELVSAVEDSRPAVETFTKTGNYTAGTALVLETDETFSKGDRLVFHLDDGQKNYEAGNKATYYEGTQAFLSAYKGSNGYVEHIVTADNKKVSIKIGASEYGVNKNNLTLYVYRINKEIKPKIVTVAADGSGMFTSLRDAIDSITDANAYTNPYVIQIYPGTYDIMSYYTAEEIADVVVPYTQTSYVGLKLTDGISLVGVGGTRDEIILTATLDPGAWSSDVRGQVSTLNLQGSNSVENLTILAYNIRYCVHDDFNCPAGQITYRKLKNLKFGGSLTNTAKFTTYGAGMTRPRNWLIEDCDFGYTIGIHGNTIFSKECQIVMKNCSGYAFFIGDYADGEDDAFVNYQLDNCDFERIYINNHYPLISPHIRLYGVGNEQTMVSCGSEYVFDFGNILKIEPGFTAGTVVRHTANSDMFESTDSIDTYCGIVINADSKNSYVQRSGFINSNFLGLSSLSIGDYVTVDSTTKKVVSGGTASNAIGVVVATESDGTAFIKMRK